MSGDEVFVTFLSSVVAASAWLSWLNNAFASRRLAPSRRARLQLVLAPVVCALLLFAVIRRFASPDVRDSALYTFQYMVMGAAWVGVSVRFLSWLGISLRDDVTERHNRAAQAVIAGSAVGLTLAFAGANIGEGPGWWVVLFCSLLSTAGLYLLLYLLARTSGCVDSIIIDRDLASGIRLEGLVIAVGLILGRAVAGDWYSARGTVLDFVDVGWPALVIVAVEIVASRALRPSPDMPRPPVFAGGVLPALTYIGLAALYIFFIGVYMPGRAEL
jgi:hypothetical protein